MGEEKPDFAFLFRTDEGRIDAATWWRNAALLAAIFAVLTLIWVLVEPFAEHDLTREPLFTLPVLAANLYRLVYGFATLLLLICYYNLSAKRWRDIGRPPALAGLPPFLACVAAALHWLAPRTGDIPVYVMVVADLAFVASLLWNIVELSGLADLSRRK